MPPPKHRPWYRPRNILLGLLALVAAAIGYQVYLAFTAKPGSGVDYGQKLVDLARSVRPGSADADNAWPLINEAIEHQRAANAALAARDPEHPNPNVEFALVGAAFDPTNPAATGNAYGDQQDFDKRRGVAMDALAEYAKQGVFATIDEAIRKPLYVRPRPKGHLIEMVLPDIPPLRTFAAADGARMHLALGSPDQDGYVEGFEQILGLGRLASSDPLIISNLVGIAITDLGLAKARRDILEGALSPQTLRGLAAALDRQGGPLPMTLAFEGERTAALDLIQWTHTDDGHGDGRRIVVETISLMRQFNQSNSGTPSRLVNLAALFYPSKKQMMAKTNVYYDGIIHAATLPVDQRGAALGNLEASAYSLPWRYDLLKAILPALSSGVTKSDECAAEIAGFRVLIALERYRADHQGQPPPDLEALAPSYLDKIPVDPFDPKHPFRYTRLDSPDKFGRRYLLYSVGRDGKDNKGSENPVGRSLPIALDTDLVINRAEK